MCYDILKKYYPFLALILTVGLLDIILFFTGNGLFSASRFIQRYEITQMFMPIPLLINLII